MINIQIQKGLIMKNKEQQDLNNLQCQEQFQTVQNYVTTLFESLPRIQLSQQQKLSNQGKHLIKKLLQQNQQYGKKIIQLSQKFTSFYRKDHIVDRKEVQQKIKQIYQMVVDEFQSNNLIQIDEMLVQILKKLKSESYKMIKVGYQQLKQSQNRNLQLQNILANNRMIQSKIEMKSSSNNNIKDSKVILSSNQNHLYHLDNLQPNGQNIQTTQVSRKQSIQSKTNKSMGKSTTKKKQKTFISNILQEEQVPLKKILKIKGFLEQQELVIKQIYQKINQKVNELKISKLNIPSQKFSYNKSQNQTDRQNLQSLLHASSINHKINLNNIVQLLDLIFNDFHKKINDEMHSENKFSTYTKEIQKRQEVYSYAVSKLIGQINNLKNYFLQHNYNDCMDIIENLISIGTKFYELYPSNSIIKDLKIVNQKKQFQMLNQRNYAVQVNTLKIQRNPSKLVSDVNKTFSQYQLQMFKLQTKLSQIFDKFEKNCMKFKKLVDVKQITKLISSIKQAFPDRNKNLSSSLISNQINNQNPESLQKFEEQYKKLSNQYTQKQQKVIQSFNKKQKSYQKQIKQLQQSIQNLSNQNQKQLQQYSIQLKKLSKKNQTLQQKYKSTQTRTQQSQKICKNVKQQIQQIKKKYREQELKYLHKFEQQQRKIDYLNKEKQQKQGQIKMWQSDKNEKTTQNQSQILLYKKKIVLLQDKNSSLVYENEQMLKKCQTLTSSSAFARQKLQQMTQIYQNKIKEVDEMIEAINQLKHQLQSKDQRLMQLQLQIQKHARISQTLQSQLLKQKTLTSQLRENLQAQTSQFNRHKQVGQLNQTDIQKLKSQITKVHEAYIQSEQQLQKLRNVYQQLQDGYNELQEQNGRMRDELKQQRKSSNKSTSLQKSNHQLSQRLQSLQAQLLQSTSKAHSAQNQLYLTKKQHKHMKQQQVQNEKQLRQLRQQIQKHREEESLTKGKYKIELQTMKIQLRKRTQQLSRTKQTSEQRYESLQQKYKELQKFISQKEMLAKMANRNGTN